MPLFQYRALTPQGKKVSGTVEADSASEAKTRLREQGLMIASLGPKGFGGRGQGLHGEALSTFTVLLAQLVDAGVPLYDCLLSLEEQYRGERFHSVLTSLCEAVKGGSTLSAAMADHHNSFDRLYCAMVAAGEASGALGPVLENLGSYLGRQQQLKQQITTAMLYPAVLGGFSLLIIALLLLFVVPSIEAIFEGRELNSFTNAVLGISHFARRWWWVYLPLIGGSVTFAVIKLRTIAGQQWWQRTQLRLPLVRTVAVEAALARFCRTMATMLTGGVSMIESLRIARAVMKNVALEEDIHTVEENVIQGRSLSQELQRAKWVPAMAARMVAVGEESGTTAIMFQRVAEIYEAGLEKTLNRVMALAQPLVLIVMGIIIGVLLLAILLPLTDVTSFVS